MGYGLTAFYNIAFLHARETGVTFYSYPEKSQVLCDPCEGFSETEKIYQVSYEKPLSFMSIQ